MSDRQASPEQKEQRRRLLLERIRRFSRLVELTAPGVIIAEALKTVLRSCLVSHPEQTGRMIGELLVEGSRLSADLCPYCGIGKLIPDMHMCSECVEETARDAAVTDFEDAIPVGGKDPS